MYYCQFTFRLIIKAEKFPSTVKLQVFTDYTHLTLVLPTYPHNTSHFCQRFRYKHQFEMQTTATGVRSPYNIIKHRIVHCV